MIYFLWTCPKSKSTLFERIVIHVSEVNELNKKYYVFHEPFSIPYYFASDNLSKRYINFPEQRQEYLTETFEKTFEHIFEVGKYMDVFVKDMGTHVVDYLFEKPEYIQKMQDSNHVKHAFLIRFPHICISSLHNFIKNNNLDGWDYFDENECGYKQLFYLKKWFQPTKIFKTEDITFEPESFIKQICEYIDVPFQQNFCTWKPFSDSLDEITIPKDWLVWKEWHIDAIQSTCINVNQDIHKNYNYNCDEYISEIIKKNSIYYKYLLE